MDKSNLIITILVIVIIVLSLSAIMLSNQNYEQCIITIFDKEYDVSQLRYSHSGGDIYRCGTDMSEDFEGQHGTDITRLDQFKITN